MDYNQQSLDLHKKHKGKIVISNKIPLKDKTDLSLVYTPGVAAVSRYLAENKDEAKNYTFKGNSVAVISDGSAVLGLGNIGPEGAYPVMEGKAMLFKHFADIDAVPILLDTQDPDEIIKTVQMIAPTFGGINLEDIQSPKCFYIEEKLKELLDIPVVHDDQWGTAVVVLAGVINVLKAKGESKDKNNLKVVIVGAGAAGTAILKILIHFGIKDILVVDSKGIVNKDNEDNDEHKSEIARLTNPENIKGGLEEAVRGRDLFIGVSKADILTAEHIKSMAKDPAVFAMANPNPEINAELAIEAGVKYLATGRSDYPNQINNALVFPGIFRGALDNNVKNITKEMLIKAAINLAEMVDDPTAEKFIPSIFDEGVMENVAKAFRD